MDTQAIGERIPGSNLVRDYCVVCGEAIRVVRATACETCLDCEPSGTQAQRSGRSAEHGQAIYQGGMFHKAEW